jgi:hypothetical protein
MANNRILCHVVLFAYTSETTQERRERIADDFTSLLAKFPGAHTFEQGANCSPENLNQGFEYCFTPSFETESACDAYLVHSEHTAFVERLKPWLAKALVVDNRVRP